MQLLPTEQLKRFIKETFLFGAIVALVVFAWVRALFFEVPFSITEDSLNLIKITLTAWFIIAMFRAGWYLLIYLIESAQQRKAWAIAKKYGVMRWMMVIVLSAVLFACNAQTTGFNKNISTGLSTRYTGLVPTETKVMMNGEVLNHHDIPLGETFAIINEGIKGLTVRDNKVSIGCSLLITDKDGKQILSEPDLFSKEDVFNKDRVTYLQCKVNTGGPMQWQEEYLVTVKFWDKYGKGTIENKMTIMIIDEP